MEGDIVPIPTCSDVSSDIAGIITGNCTLIDDGPRLCPLCNSIVKLFYINLNEKLLMCENVRCEFPFGYEDLKFYKVDDEDETISLRSRPTSPRCTGSIDTTAELLDIERLRRACDSEDGQSSITAISNKSKQKELEERVKEQEKEQLIQKNVEQIKNLNQILYENDDDNINCIQNKDWIGNLMNMQKTSNKQLLNKMELRSLEKNQPLTGELKIDINTQQNSLSSIRIELLNQKNV